MLDYGIGNLRSAQKALEAVGADAALTADRATIEAADGVVLPGVGAFGACVRALREHGLFELARDAARSSTPFLGICVGMQMLFEASDESPDASGLGVVAGSIVALPPGVKHPQMQWNRISTAEPTHPWLADLDGSWMYFVHSYAAQAGSSAVAATCEYGGPVVAAVAGPALLATQFHPEKSGKAGLHLLHNYVTAVGRGDS